MRQAVLDPTDSPGITLQAAEYGYALVRFSDGVEKVVPGQEVDTNVCRLLGRAKCRECYGRGTVRRAFGRMWNDEVVWEKRVCACAAREADRRRRKLPVFPSEGSALSRGERP